MTKCDLCEKEGEPCRFCDAIRCYDHVWTEACPNDNFKGDKETYV